jgi:hypothetical protein
VVAGTARRFAVVVAAAEAVDVEASRLGGHDREGLGSARSAGANTSPSSGSATRTAPGN